MQPRVWRLPPTPEGQYPEVAELPELMERTEDVGVALQGGGARATCQCLGTLAALEALGYMRNVRYVCSVSGATGTTGPFCFLPPQHSTTKFFGGIPSDPKTLVPDNMEKLAEGSLLWSIFERGAGGSLCDLLSFTWDETIGRWRHLNAYDQALTPMDLAAFDLFVEGSVMSAPVGTEAHKRAVDAVGPAGAKVLPMRSDAPFPILAGSRLIEAAGQHSKWCALECTPLYCGTPVDLPKAPGGHIGGGVVESFGFGAAAPRVLPGGRTAICDGEEVTVKPRTFVPLAKAVGISQADAYTHYVPLVLPTQSSCCEQALGGPVLPMWSPADITSQNNCSASVGDGGPTDPCGLLALLRRRVKKVILQCCDGFSLLDAHTVSDCTWWTSYFGSLGAATLSSYSMSADDMVAQCHVFASTALQPLLDQLIEKGKRGAPMVADLTLDVLDNNLCGVKGGWQVRVLWCFPSLSQGFRSALPKDTQVLLERSQSRGSQSDLSSDFPYVPGDGNYTTPLTQMLAESTASDLINGVPEETFIDFFGRAPQHTIATL